MKKKVAIIGHGYVGKAIREFFENKFDIVVVDPTGSFWKNDGGKVDIAPELAKKEAREADMVVVCVPTPMTEGTGKVDTSIVEGVLSEFKDSPLVLIKSTIPPGTTERLAEQFDMQKRLVFSPELIGEGGYPLPVYQGMPHPTDMKQHHYFTFGGSREAVKKVIPFFTKVRGPFCEYKMTDATTAELSKYMENVWIATKVTFCNEMYDIAEMLKVDYNELRELWLADGRVGKSHTIVYPDKRGFGGKCIPKDTNGLVEFAKTNGYEPVLLNAVLKANKNFNEENIGHGE